MRRRPVRHGLDERRPVACAGAGHSLGDRLVDGEHVVPVHPDGRDAVADGLVRQPCGGRLGAQRRRDRPLVVVAEEDERRLHHRGDVHALVERALGRRAVAEERQRDRLGSLQLQAPGEPCGVRDLRRDRDADRRDVHVLRVPPAGRMPAPPLEDRGGRQAAQQPDRRVAVAREDPVAVLERVDGTGLDRLVAAEDRVRPDPALSVVDDRPLVVRPEADERAVDREKRVVVEPVGPAIGLVSEPDHALEALLDGGNLVHTLSETAFLFCCQAREGAILRDSPRWLRPCASPSSRSGQRGRSRQRSSTSPRRSSAPASARATGSRTRERSPPSSGSRSRPCARRFACSSSPASSRCGAGRPAACSS